MPSSSSLVGLLAEPVRLRVVSALVLGSNTPSEVVRATGLDPREVAAALRRLESAGLVESEGGKLRLHDERFKDAARAEAEARPQDEPAVADPATAAVLRAFVVDGRLRQIPSAWAKRRLLLEYLSTMFEPGRRYPEKEVNAMLRAWHPDYAALRRYLVDEMLLAREAGEYWRIGGWVDVIGPGDTQVAEQPAERPGGEPAPEPPLRQVQRIAAYAIITEGDQILLTRLSRGIHAGKWTLPGGGLDFGERPADAVVREVAEEAGLEVRVTDLLDVDSERMRYTRHGETYDAHPVRIVYAVEVLGGTLGVQEVDGSTDDVRWWPRDDLAEAHLPPWTEAVIRRFAPPA